MNSLFRNILVFSLFIYSFALPALTFTQEEIDLELSKLMEAQNIGESNLRIRQLHILPMLYGTPRRIGNFLNEMHSLYSRGQPPYSYDVNDDRIITYRIYNVSFLANGQQESLILGIEESKKHSSAEILQEVRVILGRMPARWLSEVHFIRIRKKLHRTEMRGWFLSFSNPVISNDNSSFWQQMFPQPSSATSDSGIIYSVLNTIQVNLYYSSESRARTGATATITMRHELGHLIAKYPRFGYSTQDWFDAIMKDGRKLVSTYVDDTSVFTVVGDFNKRVIEEDFARTVSIYLTTYRGFYDDPYLDKPDAATDYPHRFAILDRIMGIDEMINTLNAP